MIYNCAKLLYCIIPKFIIKSRTKSDNYEKHINYCEKLLIILILFLIYTGITLLTYFSWKECTNIIDIINNSEDEQYNTKLFDRKDIFCNAVDYILVVYVIFFVSALFLNIVFGIFYHYYREYKNYKLQKNKNEYDDKIIIHIPLYNEDYDTIKLTIDSIKELNYKLEYF